MNLTALKKVDWQYLVNRRQGILFNSINDGSYRYFEKLTGIPWRVNYIMQFSDGEIYHSKRELDQLAEIFDHGGLKLLFHFRDRLIKNVSALDRVSRKIERVDFSKLSPKELSNLTRDYFTAALHAHCFLAPMPIADRVLSQKILSNFPEAPPQQKKDWLGALTVPVKENTHTKEQRSFYELVKSSKKPSFEKKLDHHLEQFGWIGARWYQFDRAWTAQDIEKRIENFLSQGKNPDDELKHLEELKNEKIKLKISSQARQLIKLAQEFAYLRTWRTDVMYRAGYRARNLFYEIAKRAKIKPTDVIWLSYLELIKAAQSNQPPPARKEIERRKIFYVIIYLHGDIKILSDKTSYNSLQALISQAPNQISQVTGNPAYPGKISGLVRMVFNVDDLKKVKPGDILVAIMTFPHFVPAMEEAAAFVTDEGGILCHAAIVSREMKKPCVIGTKFATKVFKDGDMVEVDANKGVVRLRQKATVDK